MAPPATRAGRRPSPKRASRPTPSAEGRPRRGTLAKGKPPGLGLLQRGGEVALRMLADVWRQATIRPVIETTVARGALVHTDEYDVHARLEEWGYRDKAVCHATGEYARDEDGDGFWEVHLDTAEGLW